MTNEQVASLWKASVMVEAAQKSIDNDESEVYLESAQDFIQAALSTA